MKHWLRRLLVLVLVLALLIAAIFPAIALALASNGQISIGSSDSPHIRLFMVSSVDQKGIGIEWSRKTKRANCTQTSVHYLLWEGEEAGQNVEFCRCLDPLSGTEEYSPGC